MIVGTISTHLPNSPVAENCALTLGQVLTQNDYPELFGMIGTIYGAEGKGTFRLPNIKDAAGEPFLICTKAKSVISE